MTTPKNLFPFAAKRNILKLSCFLGQLYYKILLNALNVTSPKF